MFEVPPSSTGLWLPSGEPRGSTMAVIDVVGAVAELGMDLRVDRILSEGSSITLEVHVVHAEACCPLCGHPATRIQSRYWRTLADLSLQGAPVRMRVCVRRFWCDQGDCQRAIFAERLTALAPSYARRTTRLAEVLKRVGVLLGGEAGARLLPALGLAASADTILRLVHHAPRSTAPTPRVLGVDDWAQRRGHTYGTILVDLERRAPVELLPDRSTETLAQWLSTHPGVEVITRDRAEGYAEGARQGAPNAVQVADRWHLLKNLGETVERLLHRHRPALQQAATLTASDTSSVTTAVLISDSAPAVAKNAAVRGVVVEDIQAVPETPAQQARRAHQQVAYERIRSLHKQGMTIESISAKVGLSRPTVRKYLRADTVPERASRRTKIGAFTEYDSLLRTRWRDGSRDAVALWQELKTHGFRGSVRAVQRHVRAWRQPQDRPPRSRSEGDTKHIAAPTSLRPPSPRQVRWWLLQPATRTSPDQAGYVEHLVQSCPAIASGQKLALEFARLVRARDAPAFEPWLKQAEASSLTEFQDFAAGLLRDAPAVKAALTYEWSNGQTEGQVTKVKLLKRQMYGRASVALLRQRLLLAA